MDPYKGGILQKIITGILYVIFSVAYAILKLTLRHVKETVNEPSHLQVPPDKPIPSLKLATALNPKTPVNKLIDLAAEEDPYIRRAIVRNPSLPMETIKKLESDPVPMVAEEARRAAVQRQNFDPAGYELSPI